MINGEWSILNIEIFTTDEKQKCVIPISIQQKPTHILFLIQLSRYKDASKNNKQQKYISDSQLSAILQLIANKLKNVYSPIFWNSLFTWNIDLMRWMTMTTLYSVNNNKEAFFVALFIRLHLLAIATAIISNIFIIITAWKWYALAILFANIFDQSFD